MMQHPQGSSVKDGKEANPRALDNEIVVIQQIDQTSREMLGNHTLGVDSNAGT